MQHHSEVYAWRLYFLCGFANILLRKHLQLSAGKSLFLEVLQKRSQLRLLSE